MALFDGGDLRASLENSRERMVEAIDSLDPNALLSSSEDALVEHFVSEYEVEPIALAARDEVTVEIVPSKVDARRLPDRALLDYDRPLPVDGTLVRAHVPFVGEGVLLQLQASTWSFNPPQGEVRGNAVVFERAWGGTPPNTEVTRWVDEELSRLRTHLAYQTEDIRQHNTQVRSLAPGRIRDRRSHLLASQNLQASLPFKMHPRADAPLTFVPDGVKKKAVPLPPVGRAPFHPEPALSEDQFEGILQIVRAMGHSMERTPTAFAALGEEDLRSVFLTSLNAQYEGGATGETFNVAGKTDILIRQGDRNLFIAECKIWDGPKTLTDALDQVLGYLAWRDTRAAVLLFVRRKEFGPVIEKVPQTVTQHPQYRRELGQKSASEWHYRFAQPKDATRELTLAVLAFHLAQPTATTPS